MRLSRAISSARVHFFAAYGVSAPPRTEGSLAMMTHSVPAMTPIPTTIPPPIV